MIVLTTTTDQTVQVGQPIVFDNVVMNTGCACHRANSPSAKIIGRGKYMIHFNANVGSNTADTEASVTLRDSGENIVGTNMIHMTEGAGDLNHVGVAMPINNCCWRYGTITAVNTGTTPLNVGAGASLVITKL